MSSPEFATVTQCAVTRYDGGRGGALHPQSAQHPFRDCPLNHSYPTPVGKLPVSFWNKFGRPAVVPKYALGFDAWWIDARKDAALREKKSSLKGK